MTEENRGLFLSRDFEVFVRKAMLERRRDYDVLVEKLKGEGFDLEVETIAAPVQLRGYLPTGEPFYFRSRWNDARLDIGRAGEKPFEEEGNFNWVAWSKQQIVGEELFEGSALEAGQTETVLRELLDEFANEMHHLR